MAGHFNNIVEGTGYPSMAKGFFGTGTEIGRGLTNLIPGVNIPKQELQEPYHIGQDTGQDFPYLNQAQEAIGSLGMAGPGMKIYQGAKKGIEALPYAEHVPGIIKNLLAGGATGSAISPEHRLLGGAVGSTAELFPPAINKIKDFF